MSALFPHFLRTLVTSSMNIFLMLSLLQPKYGKKVTNITMFVVFTINLLFSGLCYIYGNLTLLARLDIAVFTILCFLIRPVFRESFMQWLFSYLTVQNIVMSIMALSFSLSRLMPYPMYANTLIRLILFIGIIFLIHQYVHPLYRQLVTHWDLYFYMAAALFIAFAYYFIAGDDIIRTLTEQAVPIHLLVLITVTVYVSIFHALKTISREYALQEENLRMQNKQELLYLSSAAMEDRIKLLDEAHQQSSIAAHDRRHFNNTLLELLEREKTEDAVNLLRKQASIAPSKIKNYCENTVINAAVYYYAKLAEEKGISTKISLDIPSSLPLDSIQLAMAVSNLMENAIIACEALGEGQERTINFTCRHVGRLVLEISNPCDASSVLDENGWPVTKELDHGIGTKSVLAFAEENNAELLYQIEDGIFRVRMLV